MHDLHADPRASVTAIIDLVRRELGLDVAFVSEIDGDRRTFRSIVSDVDLPISEGDSEPYEGTYCEMITSGRLEEMVPDTAANPLTEHAWHTAHLGIGAYVGVPMRRADGELFGTLCAFSRSADPRLNDGETDILHAAAELVMRIIETEEQLTGRLAELVRPVDAAAATQTWIDLVPMVRLDGRDRGESVATPAFADGTSYRRRLSEARELGRGVELELIILARAVAALGESYTEVVSVPLSAEAVLDVAFAPIVASTAPSRLIVDVDVRDAVADYEELNAVLQPLRRLGLRVAVDRVGSGNADLQHILMLQPDVIRIDASLVRGMSQDPRRRAFVESLATLAAKLDAETVALGADAADVQWARELGVTYVQDVAE